MKTLDFVIHRFAYVRFAALDTFRGIESLMLPYHCQIYRIRQGRYCPFTPTQKSQSAGYPIADWVAQCPGDQPLGQDRRQVFCA